ncbi:MAG: filamentous hemagglutinin N-terminal domain-containing protein, partial [Candidatus Omnitrophota bacterium]
MKKEISAIIAIAFGLIVMAPGAAFALPSGYSVESGDAQFDASEDSKLVITASDHAIINFNSFSIAQNETVQFVQPFDSASVLSRVTGGASSSIYGSLFANGELLLINPNGIYFAPSANVQVGALIASTLDIQNAMYLDGQLTFEKKFGFDPASIVNEGDIAVGTGGHLVLLSEQVENRGRLEAHLGSVVLGVGEKATLNFDGQGLIYLVIDKGLAGTFERTPLQNSGVMEADGGRVLLTAEMLEDTLLAIINNTGVIEAAGAVERDGVVEFVANGIVETAGRISATDVKIGEGTTVNANDTAYRVEGDWTNEGVFNGEASTVEFTAEKPVSVVTGSNSFFNVAAQGPDKVILFEAGETQTIQGNLDLKGEYARLLKIHSTVEGELYTIDVQGDYFLDFVDVRDSYQLGGDEVLITRSHSDGNIFGWNADPDWNGNGGDNNWSTGANWDTGIAPGAGNTVTFNGTAVPNGDKNSTVDAGFGGSIAILTIGSGYTGIVTLNRSLTLTGAGTNTLTQNGGTLDLNGQTLSMDNLYAMNGGVFQATGGGTMTVTQDYVQTGGTFNVGSAMVEVNRDFSISAGTFNADTGAVLIDEDITISGTGVFNEGTSTVTLDGAGATINVLTTETFNNLTINSTATKTVAASDTLIVNGTLTLTNGNINQGTIPAAGTIAARGAINQASTFDGGSGLLVIDGAGAQLFTGTATTAAGDIPDLTINKASGTLTLSGTIRVNGNGAGAWTYTAGTVDATTNDSLVVFDGTNTLDGQGASSTMAFDNLQIAGGTTTLAGNLDIDGNFTVSAGTFSLNNLTMNLAGNYSVASAAAFNNVGSSATVILDGSSSTTFDSGGTDASHNFENLTISKTGGAVVSLINNDIAFTATGTDTLAITSGVLSLNGRSVVGAAVPIFSNNGTLRLRGSETVSWTVNDANSGTWEYVGDGAGGTSSFTVKTFTGADYFHLTIAGHASETFNLGAATDIDGNVTITSGTLDVTASNFALTVAGNWSNSSTFTPRSGTVTFDGGDQSLTGSTTFNNFTKADTTNNSTDVTLTFDNTATQTVNGLLTFDGLDANDRVNLVSDSPGTQWGLTANGTFAIDFVDVADSDASGGLTIVHSNAVNGGNNANWGFAERLLITGTAVMTAGTNNELTITATDNYGFTATSYAGPKSLTFSGLANALEGGSAPQVEGVNFGTATSVAFTSGVSNANVATLTAYRAESASVDVTDGSISSTAATNLDLTVNSAAADHLKLTGTAVMTAGTSNELSITAHDLFGNTATGYTGLHSLTFSGLTSALEGGFIPNVETVNFG